MVAESGDIFADIEGSEPVSVDALADMVRCVRFDASMNHLELANKLNELAFHHRHVGQELKREGK